MAEQLRQPVEVRQKFRRLIAESEKQRRHAAAERVRDSVPLLGALLGPIANLVLFDEDLRHGNRGDDGEGAVARVLRSLPKHWRFLNDFVLERRENEFMQIDHIAVGPSTVVVIETKKWRGAILGKGDAWKVKSKGRWHSVETSPSKQATWHASAIRRHLASAGFDADVVPLVVFVEPDWLRVYGCPCAVVEGVRALRRHLLTLDPGEPEAPDDCRRIAEFLATAKALEGAAAGPPITEQPTRPVTASPSLRKPPSPAPLGRGAATGKQRDYVEQLLLAAGLRPSNAGLESLTRAQAQSVIDRLRFQRDVPLPAGLTADGDDGP